MTFTPAGGEPEEYPLGEDCGVFVWKILAGDPPRWDSGWGPLLRCPDAGLYLYVPSDETTTLDWPASPEPLLGGNYVDIEEFVAVPLDVMIEVSEGDVLDIPEMGEPVPELATTSDYHRRFRIQAQFTCAEFALECDGTWRYDGTYELRAEHVRWVYVPVE